MRIRKARIRDLNGMYKLAAQCILRYTFLMSFNMVSYPVYILLGKVFVCIDRRRIIGMCLVDLNYAGHLFVARSYRGRGIGSELLRDAEAQIGRNYKSSMVYVYPSKVDFYRKHGYVSLRILMKKRLIQ